MTEWDAHVEDGAAVDLGSDLVVPHERTEIVGPANLFGVVDPGASIGLASACAKALVDIVNNQPDRKQWVAVIKGKKYPTVQSWQTLGAMIGVFPVPDGHVEALPWPEEVDERLEQYRRKGLTFGYRARYLAQRPDGSVLGGGEADCKRTEGLGNRDGWYARDDFALKAMCQTRAQSRALRSCLAFIVALAGYEPTAAEDIDERHPPSAGKVEQAVAEAPAEGRQSRSPKAAELDEQIRKMCVELDGERLGGNKAGVLIRAARTVKDKQAQVERLSGEIDRRAAA